MCKESQWASHRLSNLALLEAELTPGYFLTAPLGLAFNCA